MKKLFSVFLIVTMVLSLCACGNQEPTLEEKLESDAKLYVGICAKNELGDLITGSPIVEVSYIAHNDAGVWSALGTITVITSESRKELSYKFGVAATYNEEKNEFSFYDLKFDT